MYTVEIEKNGFMKARRENLRLGISETLRLDRVNLADPVMDLSSTNFGRVTSQLAPRAFQLGVRLRF